MDEEGGHSKEHYTIKFKKMDRIKVLTILVTITLALTLVNSYGLYFSNSTTGAVVDSGSQPAPNVPAPTPSAVQVDIGNAPFLGDDDAPVVIIEFTDYQCPFCQRHFTQTFSQIKSEYIDTGKVKYVAMDFPLSFHDQAQKAAEAARCVGDQLGTEGYFAMHDKLFQNQQALSNANYKTWARELNANGAQFDSCLDDDKFASDVQSDFTKGQQAGVRGTPGFIINGKLISGAQPFSAFKAAIDAEL